jgi:beta-lactamase regulating signal transducer with metallopeptidase domain
MYALRGLAVSFSVFLLVYCVLSIAVSIAWRRIRIRARDLSPTSASNLLFALRIFPLVTAAAVTAVFTVPSFLLLEPVSIDEPVGDIPLTLGICGAALAIAGIANAALAMLRASRTLSSWECEADRVAAETAIPVWRIRRAIPPMAAAGIVHPRVLLSASAESVLTPRELKSALNHEIAHVRRHDNFKKLLFRFVEFPGMQGLETAWLEATEMAADDAAVSSTSEALDLAAALIKLARLTPTEGLVELTATFVQSSVSLTNARVERLIGWTESRRTDSNGLSIPYLVTVSALTLAASVLAYNHLLSDLHTATEWLMR